MILRRPLFFLLVDSWLVLAGAAGVVLLAGVVVLGSVEAPAAGCVVSVVVGAASVAGVVAAG
jgi:hypothetical protein